jgi:DNA-binding IclR family transcriptional regulator
MIPALERGLRVLKLVLRSPVPLGYNEICAQTRLPASSATRLLQSLEEGRYLIKDSAGKYLAGNELLVLGHGNPVFERLLGRSREVLTRLSADTGNTAQLIFWNGRDVQCIDKVVDSFSISMQELGNITRDLSLTPWGWFFHDALPAAEKRQAEKEMKFRARFQQESPAWLAAYRQTGVAFDDQFFYPHVRRLAAPVTEHARLVGAVVLGGNTLTIPDDKIDAFMKRVKEAADEMSIDARREP